MRAILIINPHATATTPVIRDICVDALKPQVHFKVHYTHNRDHLNEIIDNAITDDVELVIIHGGDGTVHSVVNALLGTPSNPNHNRLPTIGIIPGGSANVFAQALGFFPDPIQATQQLITLIGPDQDSCSSQRISLIDCGECWSVINVGMGLDGQVISSVENQRRRGHHISAGRYICTAIPYVFASMSQKPSLQVCLDDQTITQDVYCAFISNGNPWTYINHHPVWTNPTTNFHTGMGLFALKHLRLFSALNILRTMLSHHPHFSSKHLLRHDDLKQICIRSKQYPLPTQIDGECIGFRSVIRCQSVPDMLSVLAPS